MVAATNMTAADNMAEQLADHDGYAYNLDEMWKAVGCPLGKDPRRWSDLAEPYIRGVAGYFHNLDAMHGVPHFSTGEPHADQVVFEAGKLTRKLGWCDGNLCGTYFVAFAYAAFLDGTDAAG